MNRSSLSLRVVALLSGLVFSGSMAAKGANEVIPARVPGLLRYADLAQEAVYLDMTQIGYTQSRGIDAREERYAEAFLRCVRAVAGLPPDVVPAGLGRGRPMSRVGE